MEVVQAGFNILYLFGCADGNVDDSELDVIKDYLMDNYNDEFPLDRELMLINSMSDTEKEDRFREAAYTLNDKLTMDDKMKMLEFSLELITSDRKIDLNEIRYFSTIGDIWSIDVKDFVRKKMDR